MATRINQTYRGYAIAANGDGWSFRAHSWSMWSAPYSTLTGAKAAIDVELDSYSTTAETCDCGSPACHVCAAMPDGALTRGEE